MLYTRSIAAIATLLAGCQSRAEAPKPGNVVFVCEHGAAKSVIAAAYFNRDARARGLATRAVARGADPQREPSTKTVAGLAADGFEPSHDAPRALTQSDTAHAARVVVFDCHTPAMAGLRSLGTCWDDTPAISGGYEATRTSIEVHVRALVDQLARN